MDNHELRDELLKLHRRWRNSRLVALGLSACVIVALIGIVTENATLTSVALVIPAIALGVLAIFR